jgi:hypothetical protein
MAGAKTANGSLADPPMLSMVEFMKDMKHDAEQQLPLVPIVAKLLAKLVEENDKVRHRDHAVLVCRGSW